MISKTLLGAIVAVMLVAPSWADIGPKPSMAFTFSLPAQTQIKTGVLYNCEDALCTKPTLLRPLGPQRFICDATRCSARAYGFGRYIRLELALTDARTVKSLPTKVAGFDSRYHGIIKGQNLVLTPEP